MSPDPLMSAILDDLAGGRIDASEAARRIDALKASPAEDRAEPVTATTGSVTGSGAGTRDDAATDPWAAATDRPQHATFARESVGQAPATRVEEPVATTASTGPRGKAANGVERISVRAVGRRVRIVGETSVATLSADGPHVLRRNGTTLEVSSDGEIGPSLDGFSILRGVPRSLEDIRALGLGKELLIRVNPALEVDVEVTAGQLSTERVPHLGKIRVTAGGAKLLDVAEVNDVLVQAGSASI